MHPHTYHLSLPLYPFSPALFFFKHLSLPDKLFVYCLSAPSGLQPPLAGQYTDGLEVLSGKHSTEQYSVGGEMEPETCQMNFKEFHCYPRRSLELLCGLPFKGIWVFSKGETRQPRPSFGTQVRQLTILQKLGLVRYASALKLQPN